MIDHPKSGLLLSRLLGKLADAVETARYYYSKLQNLYIHLFTNMGCLRRTGQTMDRRRQFKLFNRHL